MDIDKLFNTTDFIPTGIDKNDRAKLHEWANAAMNIARIRGPAKLAEGVFLCDSEAMIENQKKKTKKGKGTNYKSAPYWMVLHPTGSEMPIFYATEIVDCLFTDMSKMEPVTG
jgi:hypothetical protein